MKALIFALTLIAGLLSAAMLPAHGSEPLSATQYRLAAGDVISIRVFGEPDLSMDRIRLDESGAFSYPFLGQIQARGRTAEDLERLIHHGLLGDYLISPRVAVSVLEYREFFVNGEVRNPGGYSWQPGLTLRQAVSLAGGLTERASQRRMSIIREGMNEQQAESAGMDTVVHPGDIITIGQGFF